MIEQRLDNTWTAPFFQVLCGCLGIKKLAMSIEKPMLMLVSSTGSLARKEEGSHIFLRLWDIAVKRAGVILYD